MKDLKYLEYLKAVLSDQIERYRKKDIRILKKDSVKDSTDWQEVLSFGRRLAEVETFRISSWRILVFQLLVIGLLVLIFSRLVDLQLISGSKFLSASLANQLRVQVERAPRGVMYDRNGVVLATNTPGFRVALNTADINKEQLDQSISNLSKLLKQDEGEIRTIINNGPGSNITVAREVDHDLVLNVEANSAKLPGVTVEVSPIRSYKDSLVFAHLLGFTGEITQEELKKPEFGSFKPGDRIGKSGVEQMYEHLLHGKDGQDLIAVDVSGEKRKVFGVVVPQNGESLTLSIDSGLQKVLYEQMDKAVKSSGMTGGAAVAQDPNTGEILAMVSLPSFDNNLFAKGIKQKDYNKLSSSPFGPLLNRAISAFYPPASTFKVINSTAGLAEKIIDENTKLEAPSAIDLGGGAIFKDWKDHGVINVVRAIAESSDTFMYKIGGGLGSQIGLGPERLAKWARLFGLGSPTGVGLSGEESGLVPDPQWKKQTIGEDWYLGNTYNMSIGQGDMLVTPIQLNNAVASIANGGRVLKPSLLKGVSGAPIRESFVSKEVLEIVKKGMHEATLPGGTAWPLRDFKIATAGKTGTGEATGKETKPYAWYTAFAPYEKPTIALTVVFENAGEGANISAPVVRKAFDYWFRDQLK